MKNLFTIVSFIFLFLGVGIESFGNDPNKPDLRFDGCTICKGNTQNYSILNVYFSDSLGNPNNICESTGPRYISLLYTSNANTDIHNFRVIADIVKKDRNNPDGDPIGEPVYINEYVGSISPCRDGACIITIPIPDIAVECNNEFYELSRPLVAWTTSRPNNNNNLEDAYTCQSYPAAQCLNSTNSIPIEVGVLAYDFAPIFECFEQNFDQTNVSFIITSLFGGNPTQEYTANWTFDLPEGQVNVEAFSPTLPNRAVGSTINATLVISQGTLVGQPISINNITVPTALTNEAVFDSETMIQSDIDGETGEDLATGVIEVTFNEGDYFYYWSSLDDPEFYSEESRIDSLISGTYRLTTFDNITGTCRIDFFNLGSRILPVDLAYHNAHHNTKTRTSLISWATGKEWESSHFEIERALNGVEFEKIGEVMAMGFKDSITEYEFMDEDLPLSGGNVLYRLKQVDMNGNYVYSPVMSVRTSGIEFTSGVWRAYPNPTNGNQLRISLLDRAQYEEEKITFRLVHPSAQSQLMAVASEEEMNVALAQMVGRIPKGVFVVEIQWGQKVEHIKVLKQ
ncbi:hypothetical protein EF405_17425 [Cyclobacteriaceae bacterium YHN15]|nr:hypothetical protein EF405_17425 [Cyclobacteriaceae bacterium YHN15]